MEVKKSRKNKGLSAGQSDIARANSIKNGYQLQRRVFQPTVQYLPSSGMVGNGLTVNQRLAANDFLRAFTQETLRHDPGYCR